MSTLDNLVIICGAIAAISMFLTLGAFIADNFLGDEDND